MPIFIGLLIGYVSAGVLIILFFLLFWRIVIWLASRRDEDVTDEDDLDLDLADLASASAMIESEIVKKKKATYQQKNYPLRTGPGWRSKRIGNHTYTEFPPMIRTVSDGDAKLFRIALPYVIFRSTPRWHQVFFRLRPLDFSRPMNRQYGFVPPLDHIDCEDGTICFVHDHKDPFDAINAFWSSNFTHHQENAFMAKYGNLNLRLEVWQKLTETDPDFLQEVEWGGVVDMTSDPVSEIEFPDARKRYMDLLQQYVNPLLPRKGHGPALRVVEVEKEEEAKAS